jgi:hypothetical protein
MWVPVNTAWRVLRLRMEEQPPIWREYCAGGQIEKNEMGRTCVGEERGGAQGVGGET